MPTTNQMNSQTQQNKNSTTSEIDLNPLTLQELMDLRDRVENKLQEYKLLFRKMGEDDILIEFDVKAYIHREKVCETSGDFKIPSALDPALLPTIPMKLQTEIFTQVLEPLNAGLGTHLSQIQPDLPGPLNGIGQHLRNG